MLIEDFPSIFMDSQRWWTLWMDQTAVSMGRPYTLTFVNQNQLKGCVSKITVSRLAYVVLFLLPQLLLFSIFNWLMLKATMKPFNSCN